MRNSRDANDHARAKRFARKKRSVSRVAATNNTQEIAHKQNTFGRRMYGITTFIKFSASDIAFLAF